jgi:ankyrin repeat protein
VFEILDSICISLLDRLNGTTALNVAARNNHLEIVQFLLDERKANDCDVISHAARGGSYNTLEFLLSRKPVNLNSCNRDDIPPLHIAIENGHCKSFVKLLVKFGADVNLIAAETRQTPLHYAAQTGNLEIVKFLLSKGAEVSARMKNNCTPLNVTTEYGHLWGKTPIHFAAQNGNPETVKFLLSKGAEVSARCEYEGSPLDVASENGHLESVKILFEAERSMEAAESGMISAAAKGHLDVVNYFLEKGVNVNAKGGPMTVMRPYGGSISNTLKNETALYWATRGGHLDVVQTLIKQGGDVKIKSGLNFFFLGFCFYPF